MHPGSTDTSETIRALCVKMYTRGSDSATALVLRHYLDALHTKYRPTIKDWESGVAETIGDLTTLWGELASALARTYGYGEPPFMRQTLTELLDILVGEFTRAMREPYRETMRAFFTYAFAMHEQYPSEAQQRLVLEKMRGVTNVMRPHHILKWIASTPRRVGSVDMWPMVRELWMAWARSIVSVTDAHLHAELLREAGGCNTEDLRYLIEHASGLAALRSAARDLSAVLADDAGPFTTRPQGWRQVLSGYVCAARLDVAVDYDHMLLLATFTYEFETVPKEPCWAKLCEQAQKTVNSNVRCWMRSHPDVQVKAHVEMIQPKK